MTTTFTKCYYIKFSVNCQTVMWNDGECHQKVIIDAALVTNIFREAHINLVSTENNPFHGSYKTMD
jgi:hypothetical protein